MARPIDQPLKNERYRTARGLVERAEFMRSHGLIAGAEEWNERVRAHAQLLDELAERLFAGPPRPATAATATNRTGGPG